jgi:very-short-patch-repair endonuclease
LKKGGQGGFEPRLNHGDYVVDFYAPRAKLVVEVDGSQHMEEEHRLKDRNRDRYLASRGLKVLRFNDREVLKEEDAVVESIHRVAAERLNGEIPPTPLSPRGRQDFRPPLKKGGEGGFE